MLPETLSAFHRVKELLKCPPRYVSEVVVNIQPRGLESGQLENVATPLWVDGGGGGGGGFFRGGRFYRLVKVHYVHTHLAFFLFL